MRLPPREHLRAAWGGCHPCVIVSAQVACRIWWDVLPRAQRQLASVDVAGMFS
jgi:hypothetical protein